MLLLQNCRLIPELTEGFDERAGHVLIDGENISGIYPVSVVTELPEGATALDLCGMTLMPGMFDLHCHISFTHADFSDFFVRDVYDDFTDAIKYASTMLSYGYTTLRSCGSSYKVEVKTRDAVKSGLIRGPRIIASGHILSPTAKGNWQFPGMYIELDDPAAIPGKVRREIADGADFIKIMATGSVANPGGDPGELIITREETEVYVRSADSLGKYVAAHCHGKEGILLCIQSGVKTIEHATCIDGECIEEILRLGGKTALVPTFACMYGPYRAAVSGEAAPGSREILEQCRWAFERAVKGIRLAWDAGVRTGWGTDNSLESFLKEPDSEFTARKEMGLSNTELLRQATIESAKIALLDDKYGTVKAGKRADLIAFRGRPDEDTTVFAKKPELVIKDGQLMT